MPKLVPEWFFDGAEAKIKRLGLTGVLAELRRILEDWDLRVEERRGANGGGALRELIDARFRNANSKIKDPSQRWSQKVVGGIDWTRCMVYHDSRICIGVEIQVSGRSDLVAVDLLHINKGFRDGLIEVGVLVVPSDTLSGYLPSRFPSVSESKRMLDMFNADMIPLVFWGLAHYGPGEALKVRGRNEKTTE